MQVSYSATHFSGIDCQNRQLLEKKRGPLINIFYSSGGGGGHERDAGGKAERRTAFASSSALVRWPVCRFEDDYPPLADIN